MYTIENLSGEKMNYYPPLEWLSIAFTKKVCYSTSKLVVNYVLWVLTLNHSMNMTKTRCIASANFTSVLYNIRYYSFSKYLVVLVLYILVQYTYCVRDHFSLLINAHSVARTISTPMVHHCTVPGTTLLLVVPGEKAFYSYFSSPWLYCTVL